MRAMMRIRLMAVWCAGFLCAAGCGTPEPSASPQPIAEGDRPKHVSTPVRPAVARKPDQPSEPEGPEAFVPGTRRLCAKLLAALGAEGRQKPKTITVGNFHYKNTEFVSEFSELLQSEVLTALRARMGDRAPGREDLLKRHDTRVVMEIFEARSVEEGVAGVPDAQVTGRCWPSADGRSVRVQAWVKGLGADTGKLLSSAAGRLLVERLNVSLAPQKVEIARKSLAGLQDLRDSIRRAEAGKQNFKISLWLKDARKLWKSGEELMVHFRSERNCWLNLFHVACDGSVQLIFPNRWHPDGFVRGGRGYAIPSEEMNFKFEISAPYGADMILAVATSVRTSALYTWRTTPTPDIRFRSIPDGTRGIVVKAKDTMAKLPGDQKAEALVTFTTLPGRHP